MKQRPSSCLSVLSLPRYIAVACTGVCLTATTVNAADVGQLEEVIVTAQKRSERLLDVPISIDAVTSDEIDRRGLVSSEDYLRGMPSVTQVITFVGASQVIRGIETTLSGQNFGAGGTVATYFGETPTTTSAGLISSTTVDLKLVDIERVEVLRGPQGTAFGSSSLGGAIRTIPVAPNLEEIEGKIKTGYSVTSGTGGDNYTVQGAVNIPFIEDKLAVRAVGYWFDDHGYIRNVAGSDPAFQAYSATYGVQSFAVDDDNIGASRFKGGRIAALFQATKNLKISLNYLTQETELDGWPHQGTDGTVTEHHATLRDYEQARWQVAPQQVVRGEEAGLYDTDIDLTNVTIEYQAGWASVLGTFSHIESGSMHVAPVDTFGLPFSSIATGRHKENTGEIRLTTQLSGPWDFLAGIYAEEMDDTALFDYYWFGDDLGQMPVWAASPTPYMGYYATDRTMKQKAAFAEATWEFAPKFALTGGARKYEYDRTNHTETTGRIYGDTDEFLSADASGTNYRANLSYKPNENAHIYLGFAQGFRLGVPQRPLSANACDMNGDGILDGTSNVTMESTGELLPDSVDSYELGTKLALLDRRVTIDGAIFSINWDGVPIGVLAPSPPEGCGNGYQANAGKAQSRGVELQVNWQVTDAILVNVGGSYNDAEFREAAPNLALSDIDGVRLPGSPRVNASVGLQYEFSIGGYNAFVRTDSIYVSDFYNSVARTIETRAGDYVKVDATARVTLNKLSLELFVRNLTNEDAYVLRNFGDYGDMWGYRMRPRTIGVNLGYDF